MRDSKRLRVVVTGREGQIARALAERCESRPDIELIIAARPEFDLSRPEDLAEKICALQPDVVVNAAAYTAVDKAEGEPELAMTINAVAAGEIARGAALAGAPVIQFSTDYVFDGTLDRPYREDDPVAPLGVYGRTKLEGERAVAAANPRHVILRTAWVYSPFGNNFVKTMLRLAETRDEIGVVNDQIGNPTSAFDIADAIFAVIGKLASDDALERFGVYHFAGQGDATWYEFACAIFETAGSRLTNTPMVTPITTTDYPTPARRPQNSRLDRTRFENTFAYKAPDWRDSLAVPLDRLLQA